MTYDAIRVGLLWVGFSLGLDRAPYVMYEQQGTHLHVCLALVREKVRESFSNFAVRAFTGLLTLCRTIVVVGDGGRFAAPSSLATCSES